MISMVSKVENPSSLISAPPLRGDPGALSILLVFCSHWSVPSSWSKSLISHHFSYHALLTSLLVSLQGISVIVATVFANQVHISFIYLNVSNWVCTAQPMLLVFLTGSGLLSSNQRNFLLYIYTTPSVLPLAIARPLQQTIFLLDPLTLLFYICSSNVPSILPLVNHCNS